MANHKAFNSNDISIGKEQSSVHHNQAANPNLNLYNNTATAFIHRQKSGKGMSRVPFNFRLFNSTRKEEEISADLESEIDATEPIDVEVDECEAIINGIEEQSKVSEEDIADISSIAGRLEIFGEEKLHIAKRQREHSNTSTTEANPPPKRARQVTMAPPEPDEEPPRLVKHVIKLVPDIGDVHLFSKIHGDKIHSSVKGLLRKSKDPDIKFDFCEFERGRYKFVCPNEKAKEWALGVVPLLTGLWKDPKIKTIDCGEVPRLFWTILEYPAPETLDFFDDIELKNEERKKGDKTIIFFRVDESP